MSVRKISENKYRAYATTEKCEVETNIPFSIIKELQKRTDIDRNYPHMWSMARKLNREFEQYREQNQTGEKIWWKIVDSVVRYNNPCEYEG